MDGFAKQLPKDLPKQKFRSWEGVVFSIVLYLILLGFVWFSIEMLMKQFSEDNTEEDLLAGVTILPALLYNTRIYEEFIPVDDDSVNIDFAWGVIDRANQNFTELDHSIGQYRIF